MKVLLFTHKIDIDGIGNAVLANLAFDEVDVEYLETFEVDDVFEEFYANKKFDFYSNVFITDICICESNLELIDGDKNLRDKIKIFDHHKNNFKRDYEFCNIKIKDEKGLCCGTSLFYQYLLNNNYLKPTKTLVEFVELTRQYDTWEWKDIYNNTLANDLNLIFVATDRNYYLQKMLECIKKCDIFQLKQEENAIIENYKKEIAAGVERLIDKIIEQNIDGKSVAVIASAENKYRNEVSEVLKNRGAKFDYLVMVINDRDTISLRSINEEIDVAEIAIKLGGKGHKKASSVSKTKDNLKYFKVEN